MWGDRVREEGFRAGEMEGSPYVLEKNDSDWCGDLTDSILPESKCITQKLKTEIELDNRCFIRKPQPMTETL